MNFNSKMEKWKKANCVNKLLARLKTIGFSNREGRGRDRERVYVHKQMDKQIKRERLTDRDRERKRKE